MNGQIEALFDLSVLVDALTTEAHAKAESGTALKLAADGYLKGYLCATAIESLSDILSRAHGRPAAMSKIQSLRSALSVAAVNADIVNAAIDLGWDYLDDALTHECARLNDIEAIVTLNPGDFLAAKVAVMSPEEFLNKVLR